MVTTSDKVKGKIYVKREKKMTTEIAEGIEMIGSTIEVIIGDEAEVIGMIEIGEIEIAIIVEIEEDLTPEKEETVKENLMII